MKKMFKIGITALVISTLVYSCKQASESKSEETVESASEEATTDSISEVVSSNAAKVDPNSKRKFVRTADIKFKVKNVAKSTYAIEDATTKFGGFVMHTNLQSSIFDEDKTKISKESSLVTTKFRVVNEITIRVPNTQMDTVIKTIAEQIHFLDYRVINADDVSLQMLSNKLAQKRSTTSEKRLEKAIDTKSTKLNQIVNAEDQLDTKKAQNDANKIQNLSLEDQVNFSTLTLHLYQEDSILQEMVANEKSINAYRPNIGLQIWDSLKTGWYVLEKIISFVVLLWPFALLGFLGFFGYKKYFKKVK